MWLSICQGSEWHDGLSGNDHKTSQPAQLITKQLFATQHMLAQVLSYSTPNSSKFTVLFAK